MEVFGFGGIADTEYSAETGIPLTTLPLATHGDSRRFLRHPIL
jgi:hypothetical protein